jgi:DNA-binding transcriptional LysR family regulator
VTSPEPPTPLPTPPASGLRVGYVPGVTLTKWRRVWADRFHNVPLDVVEVTQAAQGAALLAGEVDMCFVRLPVDAGELHTIRLYEEIGVVIVPKDHPVAAFEEVTLADLAGETLVFDDDAASGVDRVAWGAGILLAPQSIARSFSRRDLVYRPVTDAEPTTIALAWLMDNPNELIEEFIGIVRGRTANSSRTAASRAATTPEKPAPAKKKPPRPQHHTSGRTPRGGRRRG